MKHLLLPLLCCLPLFAFQACHSPGEPEFRIGVSLCNDDAWHQSVVSELEHEAMFYDNMHVEIRSVSNGDDQGQLADIQAFVAAGVDLLIVSVGNASFFTPVIQEIYHGGIPVIILDQKIATDDYTAYIGGDNYLIGREAAQFVVNRLQGRGNVVVIRGRTESLTDVDRYEGFVDVTARYPGLHIVAEERADFKTDLAQEKMSEIISRNLPIDIIFAMDDLTARGVYEAYHEAGLSQPFTIGVDALPGEGGGIDNVLKGYQDVSFIYPTGGDKALNEAYNILTGRPFQHNTLLYTGMIDQANARLIQQQKEDFLIERAKTSRVNHTLSETQADYSRQRVLFISSLVIALLIAVLLVVAVLAYRSKSRANEAIRRHAEELRLQKERLEELTAELQRATDAKLAFFTNVTHEFKTPLSLIVGPLQSLLQSKELSDEQKYLLDLVKRNSDILMQLVSQIIDFNKYEQEEVELQIGCYNLYDFVANLNRLFENQVRQNRLTFRYEADPEVDFTLCFDREKMERVYLNILSNAFRFVPKQGTIRITLRRELRGDDPFVALEVYNSGQPIADEHLAHIFDRFYQADNSNGGTGIGLALAGTLVRLHGGQIDVANREQGVAFTIYLPFVHEGALQMIAAISPQEPVIPVVAEKTNNDRPSGEADKQYTVLLIEDNDDIRSYLRSELQSDYKIVEASNGRIGLEQARKYLPDLIVSDIMMPEMDGLDVCRTVKENLSTCHIPVVLLTARSQKEHEKEGLEEGADLYITKPFDADLLIVRIRNLIENRQKMREVFSRSFVNEQSGETLGEQEEKYIERFRQYVLDRISQPTLDVETIASELGDSYTTMYRKIKSSTGYTPVELVRIVRLKQARQLLNLQTKNIATVAYETGFSTPSYFTRCFKEFYQESPSDYQKRIKG